MLVSAPSPITRMLSRRLVAETLLHMAPISRAALSKVTGLSKQTVSEVVDVLERDGWAHATGRTNGRIGRTALNYELRRDAAFVFGVDLGGTKIAAALADVACNIVAERTIATDQRGGAAVIRQVAQLLHDLTGEAGLQPAHVALAVLGSPGVLDSAGGLGFAPNVAGLETLDVPAALRTALGCPVEIENDVNLAVLGERWRGSASGCEHVAFIALGTGVGLGLVSGGRLMRGARGAAGEIAYLPFGSDPASETGRRQGALEDAIGAAGIARRYAANGGAAGTPVTSIFDALVAGDPAAFQSLDETAALLARAILSIVAVIDPERVLLGGSIGARQEMVDLVRRHYAVIAPAPLAIEPSTLGSRAGLVGALAVALNRLHNQLFGVQDLTGALTLPSPAPMVSEAAP